MILKYINFLNEGMWDDLYSKLGTDKYSISIPDDNVDRISSIKKGKILDVGIGDGSNLKKFIENGFDVYGIDVSSVALKRMESELPQNHLKEYDLTSSDIIPFDNNFFDVIFARLSIHYFDDEQTGKILKEFDRIIKNNGLIFISVKIANVGNINTGKVMRTKEHWESLISDVFEIVESTEIIKKPYDYDPAPSNMLEIYARPLKLN